MKPTQASSHTAVTPVASTVTECTSEKYAAFTGLAEHEELVKMCGSDVTSLFKGANVSKETLCANEGCVTDMKEILVFSPNCTMNNVSLAANLSTALAMCDDSSDRMAASTPSTRPGQGQIASSRDERSEINDAYTFIFASVMLILALIAYVWFYRRREKRLVSTAEIMTPKLPLTNYQ